MAANAGGVVPPDWERDSLSEFLDKAHQNTLACFANLKPIWTRLREIHDAFRRAIDSLQGATPPFPIFFLLRTHASYLGAVKLAVGTLIPESYMVMRGCLENALYGLFLFRNPELAEVWLKRHDDKASKARVREEFKIWRMLDLLEAMDRRIGSVARTLYERTIDFGAHPNERALTSNLRLTTEGTTRRFDLRYLTEDSTALRLCLKTNAQVGVTALHIFSLIYPERFAILGISEALVRLREDL